MSIRAEDTLRLKSTGCGRTFGPGVFCSPFPHAQVDRTLYTGTEVAATRNLSQGHFTRTVATSVPVYGVNLPVKRKPYPLTVHSKFKFERSWEYVGGINSENEDQNYV